jgi:hypothetical protein
MQDSWFMQRGIVTFKLVVMGVQKLLHSNGIVRMYSALPERSGTIC